MRKFLIVSVLFLIGFTVSGAPRRSLHHGLGSDPYTEEIQSILSEVEDRTMSDLTFGEVGTLMEKLSVPLQKAAYIQRSRAASMAIPGMGQFKNGDALSGTLFLAGDVLATAGTVIGLYLLLPPELQYEQLKYFTTPASDLKAAFKGAKESMTFVEALPSIGVAAGGMLLHHGLRIISANHAEKLARENIESGKVTFEPRASFVSGRNARRLGIGMALRY